jgi:hypothetical protein
MNTTLNTKITDYGQKLTTIDGDPVAIIRAVYGQAQVKQPQPDGYKWKIYMLRSALDIKRRGGDPQGTMHFNNTNWRPLRAISAPGYFRSLEAAQYRVLAEHIEANEAASWKRTAERFATT